MNKISSVKPFPLSVKFRADQINQGTPVSNSSPCLSIISKLRTISAMKLQETSGLQCNVIPSTGNFSSSKAVSINVIYTLKREI